MNQNKLTVFLHMPKAGGTTLRRIAERQCHRDEILTLSGRPAPPFDELNAYSTERLARFRLIRGHMMFGIHQYFERPASYFTMVRKPVDRILSLYWYFRRVPANPMHQVIVERNMDLAEFVQSGMVQVMHHQTRMISGYSGPLDGDWKGRSRIWTRILRWRVQPTDLTKRCCC